MLALYAFTLIVGGGLVLFSALGGAMGHGDVSAAGDVPHDLGGHDGPGHSEAAMHNTDAQGPGHDLREGLSGAGTLWLPFLSFRFWTYALATFGAIGLALTLLKAAAEPMAGLIAAGAGLGLGWVAAYAVQALSRPDSNSAAAQEDFLGALGRMTVATRAGAPGKVRTTVKGDVIDMVAQSEDGTDIAAGDEVLIVGFEGDRVRVARKDQFLGLE